MLFQNIVVNYTPHQGAAFVLDEVVVRMTYSSSWAVAERILLQAAAEVTGDVVQKTGVQPYIRAQMYEYGVQLFLRFMTPATDRTRVVYELTRRIVSAFAKSPEVDFALPFVFSHRTGLQMHRQRRDEDAQPLQVRNIGVHSICPPPPSETSPEVAELADSIAQHGLLQPIIVREKAPGTYAVVAGERRFAACAKLGWSEIPCFVSDSPADPAPRTPPQFRLEGGPP